MLGLTRCSQWLIKAYSAPTLTKTGVGGRSGGSSSGVVVDVEMTESLGKCSQVGIFIKSGRSVQSFMRLLAILTWYV